MRNYCQIIVGFILIFASACEMQQPESRVKDTLQISKDELKSKIKGGWAGQTIGVAFGGPTEFHYQGTFMQDYQPIPWYDGYLKDTYEHRSGIYDDIYMDLTFVDMIEKKGMDASAKVLEDEFSFDFKGKGFVLMGYTASQDSDNPEEDHVFDLEVYIDGNLVETAKLPTNNLRRRNAITWEYQLPKKEHKVRLKLLNPREQYKLNLTELIVYSDKLAKKYNAK